MYPWHQYLLGLILILSGFNHFRVSKKYENMVPSYLPAHSSLVILSGIIEMVMGLMLLTRESQNLAAWGIMVIATLYLLVPLYMLNIKNDSTKYPKWIWLICILLLIGIFYWAYLYI